MENLIKNTNNLAKEDIAALREKFITEYSRNKGWNFTKLTPNQMIEIVEQSGYRSPGIILG
jgi:transcriptional regulator with PAS, ATPase and Fis domain